MDTCKRMWSKDEIGSMAGGSLYKHNISVSATNTNGTYTLNIVTYLSTKDKITISTFIELVNANKLPNIFQTVKNVEAGTIYNIGFGLTTSRPGNYIDIVYLTGINTANNFNIELECLVQSINDTVVEL